MHRPTIAELLKQDDNEGKLPSYTQLGGYQILYLDREGNTLCPDCANKELAEQKEEGEDYLGDPPVEWYLHEEGADVWCEGCNTPFDSAHGDPEAEEVSLYTAEDCYYADHERCSGDAWECLSCKQVFCGFHNHTTDKGNNVECVGCERVRNEQA